VRYEYTHTPHQEYRIKKNLCWDCESEKEKRKEERKDILKQTLNLKTERSSQVDRIRHQKGTIIPRKRTKNKEHCSPVTLASTSQETLGLRALRQRLQT
jgi:hypothetical protein